MVTVYSDDSITVLELLQAPLVLEMLLHNTVLGDLSRIRTRILIFVQHPFEQVVQLFVERRWECC